MWDILGRSLKVSHGIEVKTTRTLQYQDKGRWNAMILFSFYLSSSFLNSSFSLASYFRQYLSTSGNTAAMNLGLVISVKSNNFPSRVYKYQIKTQIGFVWPRTIIIVKKNATLCLAGLGLCIHTICRELANRETGIRKIWLKGKQLSQPNYYLWFHHYTR